jgi:multidrug efflux pump subunit AcrB
MRGPVAWMASNPVAANLLLLIVAVAGLFAIETLDKEVFPSFPTETFTITVPYPGSSPEEVERGIVLRIEEAVRDIVGIKELRSEAREGVGIVTVIMEPGSDMSKAVNLAKVRVDGIVSFPAGCGRTYRRGGRGRTRAIRVSLFGDIEGRKLKELSEQIREEILALGNISEISMLRVSATTRFPSSSPTTRCGSTTSALTASSRLSRPAPGSSRWPAAHGRRRDHPALRVPGL